MQAELLALREEIGVSDDPQSYFRIRVLGGEWSLKLFKKIITGIGCYVKDKSTKTWRDAVGWSSSRSFAVQKYRGVANVRMLAEEIRRKEKC